MVVVEGVAFKEACVLHDGYKVLVREMGRWEYQLQSLVPMNAGPGWMGGLTWEESSLTQAESEVKRINTCCFIG